MVGEGQVNTSPYSRWSQHRFFGHAMWWRPCESKQLPAADGFASGHLHHLLNMVGCSCRHDGRTWDGPAATMFLFVAVHDQRCGILIASHTLLT